MTYNAGVSRFLSFCHAYNLPSLPASESTILRFVALLHQEDLSAATVRVYLSGIANFHEERNVPSPTNSAAVQRLMNGMKRVVATQPDKRLPITLDLMRHIKSHLAASTLTAYDQSLYWTACTFAYFGALRVSEFACPTTSTFDPRASLLATNVLVEPQKVQLTIQKSKTDQYGEGCIVTLCATGRSICPASAATRFLELRRKVHPSTASPFFLKADGRYLTRATFEAVIKRALADIDNLDRYSSHSFRIGSASTAAANGESADNIKRIGRWKSDVFNRYVRSEIPIPGLRPYSNERT